MKAKMTACLVFTIMTIMAQAGQDLMVFNSWGEVHLKRGNILITKPRAETLSQSDHVIIKNGAISLINNDSKRVTLTKPGTYDYATISGMMDKAEASVITRYFIQVWKAMNANPEKHSVTTGGIVRTYDNNNQDSGLCLKLFPVDSARIITERFCMVFDNSENAEYSLSVFNADRKSLREYKTNDTIFKLHHNEINQGIPGVYMWTLGPTGDSFTQRGTFIIPETEELKLLFSRFSEAYEVFSDFDNEMFSLLLAEYFKVNKVFVCLY